MSWSTPAESFCDYVNDCTQKFERCFIRQGARDLPSVNEPRQSCRVLRVTAGSRIVAGRG